MKRDPSSFRDPSGFIFWDKGQVYRQVNDSFRDDYELLKSSGLYTELVEANLLVEYRETRQVPSKGGYKIIKPTAIPIVSYPYEWSFGMLKDAALTTLAIQKKAVEHGMTLKDASTYNIQFVGASPVMVDTLSFEQYKEGEPWVAYKQFCQHFLAPLALTSYVSVELQKLLRLYLDGVPLPLASKLLPKKSWLSPALLMHIHMHAKSQDAYAGKTVRHKRRVSKLAHLGLIDSLEQTVQKLTWQYQGDETEWGDYYTFTNYSKRAFSSKGKIVKKYVAQVKPKSVWDLGANSGEFSSIAAQSGAYTVAADIDPIAVEKCYLQLKSGKNRTAMLPLVIDLTNPSPSLGWAEQERMSLSGRGGTGMVMALALIHHLAISNNLPFAQIAEYFARLGKYLVIEFVPKEDSKVQILLSSREDIFPGYTQTGFEEEFGKYYTIMDKTKVTGSKRTMYLMKAKAR